MGCCSLRSLLLAAIVLSNCITWTASRHHYTHKIHGHRSRHRRQGNGPYHPPTYVIPLGDGGGAWGEWGEVSPCSRTCGGGVASQKRICLQIGSDGQPLCSGGDTRYFSCNTQDCPPGSKDFREEQCMAYNRRPNDNWVPYLNAPNPCELNCMPKGEWYHERVGPKVVDGTLCNSDYFDVCVDGTCQPVGCDRMLGSSAREDNCRQCRGNGTNCDTVVGVVDDREFRNGYNDVLFIPEGAMNILIEELQPSDNYFALRAADSDKFYMHGGYVINGNPRSMPIAGTLWHYDRIAGFKSADKLRCLGPTNEPLYLSLLLTQENVGIRYEYSIPSSEAPPPTQQYNWEPEEFSACNVPCGEGYQTRNVWCRSSETREVVDDGLCNQILRPSNNQTCNNGPCQPTWVEGPWSPCSKRCGEGGTRSRQVQCQKIFTNGATFRFPSIVADDECFNTLGPKPPLHEECNEGANCPSWFTSPWKPCDKLCGEGRQTRQVVCHQKSEGRVELLPDEECAEEKPPAEQECMLRPCDGVDWVLSDWSGCDTCLSILRTRAAECASKDRKVVNSKFCAYHPTPELEQPCDRTKLPPCTVQWYATQWSNCSVECGKGVKTRRVFCGLFDGASVQKVGDERCDTEDKYNDTVSCEIPEDKCPAKWFGGPWSECTKKCGGGEQFRRVMCLNRGVESSACDADTVLDSTQACNTGPCDKDEMLPFDSKSTPVMDEDYDYEECEEDEDEAYPEMGVEEVTPKGTDFSDIDLMFSDSPTTGEGSGTGSTPFELESEFTIETGSGTGSTLTTDTLITEGSGTGPTETTGSETSETGTTESGATESTGSSTDSSGTTETATTGSTETGSTETEGTGSTETEGTGSTETERTGSTETEETGSTETEGTGSTETEGTGSTETEGTGSTETEGTGSTETEGTGSTETEGTTPTETTGTGTTESGATEVSTTEGSESTATGGTKTETTDTETTKENTTETGTTETGSTETETTESITTDTESTDTSSTDTATTESITTETETTVTATTETGSTETTETGSTETGTTETGSTDTGSTEKTGTESSTTESGITETTETGSTETGTTETGTTESVTTETGSTEGTATTESTTAGTTETGSTETGTEGSTTESGTESTGSTEGSSTEGSTTEITTETGGTETTETGSTGTTESEGTSTTDTETTGTGETGTTETATTETGTTGTETTGTTESGATETTESGATEISSTEGSSTTETEESSTSRASLWEWASTKKPHCKPKRPAKCSRSKFGCCPDKKTPAAGPFDEGCPNPKTCKETKYGCCPDGVSPAGPRKKDCPATPCNETLFGCCKSDNKTASKGNDQEGCPPPPPPCMSSKYGCCMDNKTEAKGPKKKGCPETEPKPKAPDCSKSKFGCCYDNKTEAEGANGAGCPCNVTEFGCCPDGVTAARGADDEGCAQSCDSSAYGCCPDGKTPAHGPDQEGCCLLHPFGCCPDNYKPAEGPHLEGCGCQYARYGCCPDNVTIARGPRAEGCGCQRAQHGCCPDRHTEAAGPNYEGCGCNTYQFGCCEDGITTAKGPNFQGCRCQESSFGCCGDEKTAATGPDRQGCDCSNSKHGCCPDGQTEAQGDKFLGCTDKPANRQAACSLKTDRGPCRNYSVYWFYDTDYGGCSRFWYGGCDGNGNRFANKEECEDVCVQPPPKDACNLPRIKGACAGYHPRWYFDTERQQCGQFIYSGCLGNANNFDTRDLCQAQCEPARIENQCYQPLESGPCAGSFYRWGFNSERGSCEQYVWGGCGGTANRFDSEAACVQRCDPPGGLKPKCTKAQAPGECSEKQALWSFSQSENRCVPFYYTGCGGNENQFTSEQSCTDTCPSAYVREVCTLPAMTGDCADYREKWYYDTAIKRCRQFYYGGCGGNGNNFDSEMECERSCSEHAVTPAPTPPPTPPSGDTCSLSYETGECADYTLRWYYNTTLQVCLQFYYGGCGGNDNNFETQRECEGQCGERAPRPSPVTVLTTTTTTTTTTTSTAEPPPFVFDPANCLLPLDAGPCSDMTIQWGFDRALGKCVSFQFGGCGGNQNNFPTQEHCDYYCRQAPAASVDICQQPMSSGPCEDSLQRWFYNQEIDSCNMFMYSGCEGNENRFDSREACERRCRRTQPAATTTTVATVTEAVEEQCRLPTSLEPCERNITAYYYDPRYGSCLPANIGACPLANRHRSEEECLRSCGQFRGVDVCRYPVDAGSCQEEVPKFYWNEAIGSCEPFRYSGCYGGPNRFSTADECEQICGSRRPDVACTLPVATGEPDCGVSVVRWHYSEERGDCIAFIYAGCGGNANNFHDYNHCAQLCFGDTDTGDNEVDCDAFIEECSRLNCEYGIQRTRTADETCERCSCVQVETNCSLLEQECERLKCNYGMETTTGADGCQRCKCLEHPCAGKQCGEQEKCVAYRDPSTADVRYISECRIRFRPGLCPSEEEFPTGTACRRECIDDVDCRDGHKCCSRGCQQLCLEPVTPTSPAPYTTTYVPGPELPQKPQANPETQLDVTASESGRAVLRCLFHGNPPPKISWRRGEITIDGTVGRYQLHSDGALEIVSLYRNDSGVYICIADNALGTARQEIRLQVNDPVEEPAQIAGEPNAIVTGEFGGPLSIRCLAYGHPTPSIAWYRGTTGPMVPYSNEIYEARGNVLLIRSLLVNTLGEYVCQAYNAIGKPASWSVIVKAYRPMGISVDSPFFVDHEPEIPVTVPYVPPVYVPASTKLAAAPPTLASGSELQLYCRTDGEPAPDVYWTKDGARLAPGARTHVSATELRISGVTVEDSGEYGCHAVNSFSEHRSTARVAVQAASVPALCTDNPFFANCTLIVRSKFCRHNYYSKLCCKSCVEAGQLNPEDLQMLSDQSWKKKK